MTIERLLDAGRALEADRLDVAERIYRQVANADPRSSIAVVGLARVALRRGRIDDGLELARAALAIDPGNVAAARLLAQHAGSRAADTGGQPDFAPGGQPDVGGQREAGGPPAGVGAWPWPDLEAQLARYRQAAPGRLARLLGRRRG